MAALEPLTEAEQQQYDLVDVSGLELKITWLTAQMERMIDGGELTVSEKADVLSQLSMKLEQLKVQAADAESDGKTKRADKARTLAAELEARCATVRELKPTPYKPKFEAEIRACQKKLKELEKLEKSKVVLPLEEVQKLNAKPKLLEDLAAMMAESRGWFADE